MLRNDRLVTWVQIHRTREGPWLSGRGSACMGADDDLGESLPV